MRNIWYSFYRDVYENIQATYYDDKETAYNGYLALFADTSVQWAVLYYNGLLIDRCDFWQGTSYAHTPLTVSAAA